MDSAIDIVSARAICAQDCFPSNRLPETVREPVGNIHYFVEPDYKAYFSIMQLRRMSRLTRAGITAAIECLKAAGISKPQAIITGTGKGSLGDTEKFMHSIREFDEGTLNPSPFIQSTYNALNGLIGLHHDVDSYNTTYVHRGFSLEHAFQDAMMLFNEGAIENALVGSFEEITAEHFIIKKKLGYWKNEEMTAAGLLASATSGAIAGEGCFFFGLAPNRNKQPGNASDFLPTADQTIILTAPALATILALKMLFEPSLDTLNETVADLLKENGLAWEDIDVLLQGRNGDIRNDFYYNQLAGHLQTDQHELAFKHICGEFDTASGFALWLACGILSQQEIPSLSIHRPGSRSSIRHVLIYNNYFGKQHAIYLLSAAKRK